MEGAERGIVVLGLTESGWRHGKDEVDWKKDPEV